MSLLRPPPRPPDPGRSSSLAATGISVSRGGVRVVTDVDLALSAGEVVAVAGPNGSGKSTIVGAIAGDLPIDAGAVVVDGEPLGSWTPTELAMRRAVLLQQTSVSFPFTVGEVVTMGRAPWAGTSREDADAAAIARALDDADVADLVDRPVTELSGGERARVALARVLAQESSILLLDEPTASLDIRHAELVMRVARARATAGAAVLVVVHDLGLASAHADRVILLDGGRVAANGSPVDVLRPDLLGAAYGTRIEIIAHPRTGQRIVLPWRD